MTEKDEQVFPVLGTVENLPDLIKTQNITELILTHTADSARCYCSL